MLPFVGECHMDKTRMENDMKAAIGTTAILGLSMSDAMACDYQKYQAAAPMSKIRKSAAIEAKQSDSRQLLPVPQGDPMQGHSATVVAAQ